MKQKLLMLSSGYAATSALFLLRSLIVARLVSVADYGIAATFAMVVAVTEMLSAIGLQQQLVQAKDGDQPALQKALQGFHLMRGVFSACVIAALAWPVAQFMKIPEAAPAYVVLALYPLIFGFTHYDVFRQSRNMAFGPLVAVNVLPALLSLLSLALLVWVIPDYRLMLAAMLVQALTYVLVSHLTAKRRYQIAFDRKVIARSLAFGWPLLLNSALLFLVFQGDKTIVGRLLGLEALAVLTMGFTLTLAPSLLISKTSQSFFLPLLSRTQDRPAQFEPRALAAIQAVSLAALALVVAITCIGGPLALLLLGERYAALPPLLIWLGLLQGIRVLKSGPTVVAMAQGHTGNAMIANLTRVVSLPLAYWIANTGGDLQQIIFVAILGEIIGFAISLSLLRARRPQQHPLFLRPLLPGLGLAGLSFAAVAAYGWQLSAGASAQMPPLTVIVGLMGALLLTFAAMPELRGILRRGEAIAG